MKNWENNTKNCCINSFLSAKRKRRKRRRKMTKPLASGGHQSLNTLFRHIQVFPLKQYRELRTDYLR